MFRPSLKSLVMGAVLVASLVAVSSEANAFWGHRGWGCGADCGWGGCWSCCAPACYRPCMTSCSPCLTGCDGYNSGSWYLGYRPGPVRRLLLGPCRWYWGEGACGDPCGPSIGCTGCAPVTTVTGPAAVTVGPNGIMDSGTIVGPAPTLAQPPLEPMQVAPPAAPQGVPATVPARPAPATMLPDSTYMDSKSSGLLTIIVPADAKVMVNGMLTRSTGSRRQYVSYGLTDGYSYKYDVQAEVIRDGKSVVETRSVILNAGSRTSVAFGFNVRPNQEVAAR